MNFSHAACGGEFSTIAERRDSLNGDDDDDDDDEGNASGCNVRIDNGILKGCIQDATNARLRGVQSTGNGRRESLRMIQALRVCQ